MNLPSKPRPLAYLGLFLLLSAAQQGTALQAQDYDDRSTGEKVGGFFRRMFYGEPAQNVPYGPRPSNSGGRYNLDQPPAEMRYPRSQASRNSDSIPPPPTPPSGNRKRESESSSDRFNSKAESSNKRPKTPVKEDEPPSPRPKVKKTSEENEPDRTPLKSNTQSQKTEPTPPVTIKSDPPVEPVKPDQGYTDSGKQSEKKKIETKTDTLATNDAPAPRNTPTTVSPPKQSDSKETLTGTKTSKPGRVKSPYSPFNELDVQGLNSGQLALDPTTQRVFRVP